ncbi:hypothetical protein HET55_004333 [Escherichia coli]|nr:hypothetical protein [Escherichia coli]EGY5661971.1 hypothetical protein [Escherichia coli]EGZ0132484.1 hypothetical protein [Escherichia coli]EGZ0142328.1 hypothetical protein [Escherichia coli]
MSLLFAERPLVINTQLAMKIGLNEAIVLQQLHYWLRDTNSGMECDGVRWIYNTTEQWLEQFPFWSESTLKRAFASLKTLGLLRCEKLNKSKRDMTNFYTINYGSELLDGGKLSESIGLKCAAPSGQNGLMILQRIQQRLLQRIKTLFVRKLRNRTRRPLNRIF